jgi:signal transduction histidine kinase
MANPDVTFIVDSECKGATVYTDRVKVLTILRNLLTNALKFTSQGSVRLHISMSGATIRFALHDTGIGIAAEEQEAIFEPYRKSRDGDETESEGVGLGLALSRRLARLLGGDVRVRSDLGKGSEFTLILRVADALAQHEDESPARRYLKPTIPFAASV